MNEVAIGWQLLTTLLGLMRKELKTNKQQQQ